MLMDTMAAFRAPVLPATDLGSALALTICSICGGNRFVPGYGGRLAPNGTGPTCDGCGSAERHRIIHGMYRALLPMTRRMKCLQFAPDASLSAANFAGFDTSVYNGRNSMDMTQTGLPDGSYDLVASSHVL